MEKNRYPKISGGVDNHYKKRAMLTALLLSALFCWENEIIKSADYTPKGINGERAWTGTNPTIDEISSDKYDFSVSKGLSLTVNKDIKPKIIEQQITTVQSHWENAITIRLRQGFDYGSVNSNIYKRLPANPTDTEIAEFNKNNTICTAKRNSNGNIQLYRNGKEITSTTIWNDSHLGVDENADKQWYIDECYIEGATYKKEETKTTQNIKGDSNITITGASSLTSKAGVQTTKAINVNTNSKLNAAGAINGGSITADASTITGASITSNQELSATNGGNINAINGNLTANHITVTTGSTVSATGTITTTGISANNGKIKAGNLTTNSLSIWNGSMVDISKGTLTINGGENWLDTHTGKIKAKFLKVKNTTGKTNSIGSDTHITGGLTLKGKAQTVSAGATNTDLINKAQMTTALNNAKPNLGKTYSAGTGINLNTNNAVGLTNATAYTTTDKKRISLVGAAKTYVNKVKTGKVSATSKDLINGSQLYAVQQSIAGFADRIQTNKNQLETLKSSINAKKAELSGIQKSLNTIKGTKLNQDMSNLTTDGEAVIKNQVKKAIQKFQKDMDVSTVQANVQEAKVPDTLKAMPAKNHEPSIMLADTPIEGTHEPINVVSAISKEDVDAKANLTQTKVNLEKKATLDTMDVSAYTKQLSKSLSTGENAYQAIQEAKENRLVQTKENTLTVGANSAETKIDASKKNWTGILADEKEAGSMANVGYVDQTLSMESSYDRLNLMKKDLEKDTNKGIAKAAALAALKPIGHDEEDKVSFAIGYGHYKDGNAAAIGTFFRPSQDILIHLDITAGAGKPGMNTGVSFKVGKGSSYASMTREELAAENTAMKNQAEKQDERIHTQKEKIEHLESVMQSIRF